MTRVYFTLHDMRTAYFTLPDTIPRCERNCRSRNTLCSGERDRDKETRRKREREKGAVVETHFVQVKEIEIKRNGERERESKVP